MLREELIIQTILREQSGKLLQSTAAAMAPAMAKVQGTAARSLTTTLDALNRQANDLIHARYRTPRRYRVDQIIADQGSYMNMIKMFRQLDAAKVFDALHNFGKDQKDSRP